MLKQDITVYETDPYEKENLVNGINYVSFIDKYAFDKSSFLELGIGHGKTIELLQKKFNYIKVLDGDEQLVAKYSKIYPKIDFTYTYFENFKSSKLYKFIGMGFILEHVDNPESIIKNYAQFLEKDGLIFVGVPNASSLHRIIANKAGLLDDIKVMNETDIKFGHQRFLTYQEWLDVFEKCDMEIVARHGLFLKPFTTKQIEFLNLNNKIYDALGIVASDLPEISNACFFVIKPKEYK